MKAKSLDDFDSADLLIREQLKEDVTASSFISYYEQHVQPVLREQLYTGLSIGFASANWTNNNAESKNYILKMICGSYIS